MLLDDFTLIERVVDCPYFPFAIGQWPFIVLFDEDMVLLSDLALENQVEVLGMHTCFFDRFLGEEEFKFKVIVEGLCFLIFDM
jgi:hypothetical protein